MLIRLLVPLLILNIQYSFFLDPSTDYINRNRNNHKHQNSNKNHFTEHFNKSWLLFFVDSIHPKFRLMLINIRFSIFDSINYQSFYFIQIFSLIRGDFHASIEDINKILRDFCRDLKGSLLENFFLEFFNGLTLERKIKSH